MLVRFQRATSALICLVALVAAQAAFAAGEPAPAGGEATPGGPGEPAPAGTGSPTPGGAPASGPAPGPAPASEAPPTRLAYVTETARSPARVWVAAASGREAKLAGPGNEPLIAPNGRWVAASLFGVGSGAGSGPALAVYAPLGGARHEYLRGSDTIATPLAWSPDSRYLAVSFQETAIGSHGRSGLAVVDTETDSLAKIAYGQIFGASFARDGSDRVVYGKAPSLSPSAPVNLYVSGPHGAGVRALTHDGHSLNPLWGPRYIAYDRERLRSEAAPAYQIWLASPTRAALRRVTDVYVGPLVSGLVPIAFSAGGARLVAEFEGQDTSEAWTVRVASGRARRLTVRGRPVMAGGISRDGATVLIDEGAFEEPPSNGRVASVPFAGGRSTVLVAHGAQASWSE
jgi:hypothetical protein